MFKVYFKAIPTGLFHLMGIIAVFVLLVVFFLTVGGAIDLSTIKTVQLPFIAEAIIFHILRSIDLIFVLYIVLKPIEKPHTVFRAIFLAILFLPIQITGAIFVNASNAIILSGIIPAIYIFLIAFSGNDYSLKETFFRYLIYFILLIPNQLLLQVVRLHLFGIGTVCEVNALTALILSVDNILMLLLLTKEVEFIYERCRNFREKLKDRDVHSVVQLVPRREECLRQNSGESTEEILDQERPVDHRRKFETRQQAWYYYSRYYAIQFIRLGAILLIGFLLNVFWEVIIMFAVFFLAKGVLVNVWHGNSIKQCTIASMLVFLLMARLTVPLSVSILFCIVLSGLFVFILDRVGKYTKTVNELKERMKNLEDEIQQEKEIDFRTCSQEEFTELCKLLGFKPKDIEFAWKSLRLNYSYKDLAEEFVYAIESIKNKKRSLLIKLRDRAKK